MPWTGNWWYSTTIFLLPLYKRLTCPPGYWELSYSYLPLFTASMFFNRHFVTFHIKLAQRPLKVASQSYLHDISTCVFSLRDTDISANLLNNLNRSVQEETVKYTISLETCQHSFIDMCSCVICPSTQFHQLVFHPSLLHLAIYFSVYLSALLFPNSYLILLREVLFSSILCTYPNQRNLFSLTVSATVDCLTITWTPLLVKLSKRGNKIVIPFSFFRQHMNMIGKLHSNTLYPPQNMYH